MQNWIFIALLFAAVIHILEEYIFPGGFANGLQKLLPKSVRLFTPGFHIIVNALLLALCIASLLIGQTNLVLSLSVFSLVFVNAILHIRGSIVTKGYYPGMISGTLVYIPLSVYAYWYFISNGQITWQEGLFSALLGAACMGALMVYVLLSGAIKGNPH